jgi:hypothetical protein
MAMLNITGGVVSMNALNNVANVAFVPFLAIIIFCTIVLILFLLFKNFRRFLYGICVIVPTAIIGSISKSVAQSAGTGDWVPTYIIIGIGVLIIFSIGVGYFVEKFRFIEKIEAGLK